MCVKVAYIKKNHKLETGKLKHASISQNVILNKAQEQRKCFGNAYKLLCNKTTCVPNCSLTAGPHSYLHSKFFWKTFLNPS